MQNSELKKEILGQLKEVSAKDLDLYKQGKLSAERSREVENILHSNSFSSEAAAGFEAYGIEMPIGKIGAAYRSANYRPFYFSAFLLIIAGSTWFFWPESEVANHTVNTSTEITQTDSPEVTSATQEVVQAKEKETTHSEPTEHTVISTIKENKTAELEEEIPILFSAEIEKEIFTVESIETKTSSLELESEPAEIKSPDVRLRHYKNYKLVDQGIGIDQSLLVPILDNTPAFSERIVINPEYPEWMDADSVYQLTINKVIDQIITERYSEAQMKLERLVENTPSDLTATFYLGYVHYLRQNYEKAIKYFNKTESHFLQTYDHDARFLEIKCLLALGRDQEAKTEAEILSNSESFYAEKALELVD